MNRSELQSKHLSELHALAEEAGIERYRMLGRAELIDRLAAGGEGAGGGGSAGRGGAAEGRPRREQRGRRERGGRQPRSESRSERPPAPPRSEAQASQRGGEERESGRPRRRRRRRFRRRSGRTARAHEMLMPAGAGRQALVYAESREACTSLLRELAAELSGGKGPDPIALLVDPSPEELADWKREAPRAEIVSAGKERHAEDAIAQASRRAGGGEDVVLLIDSLSRVAEQFGGARLAKELFDSGLGAGGGSGSLTVVAAIERPTD